MRTKNLNLKKKIAFIASVAMIATSTAAYLPFEANAAKLIGADGYTSDVVKGAYADPATDPAKAAAVPVINTFDVLIKVNGKYLAQNNDKTAKATQYKLFDSLEEAEKENYSLTNMDGVNLTPAAASDDVLTHPANSAEWAAADVYSANAWNYTSLSVDNAHDELLLPYFAEANPKITLEFVAKKGATLTSRSVKSIDITLDDNGIAKLPTQKSYVIGKSDNSNYDEKEEEFVGTNGKSTGTPAGTYEVLDLSKLKIRMGAVNGKGVTADDSEVDFKSFDSTKLKVVETNTAFDLAKSVIDTKDAYPKDEDDVTPVSYEVKKVNGKYAKVLTTTIANTKGVAPGSTLKVQTGVFGTWSKSSNVSTDGTITLTMGGDGYAKSDLVTFTKDGVSEYYVYVVKNAEDQTDDTMFAAVIDGVAGIATADAKQLGAADNDLNAKGRYKVTKKLLSESFADGTIELCLIS